MPRTKPTSSLDQLRALQQRERELQAQRQALEEQAVGEMASLLIAAEALSVDTDVLLGGVLEVVSQARVGGEKVEAWRAAGRRFRGLRAVGSGRARRKGAGYASAPPSAETGAGLTDAPDALKGEA